MFLVRDMLGLLIILPEDVYEESVPDEIFKGFEVRSVWIVRCFGS